MTLTTEQLTTLGNDIRANSAMDTWVAEGTLSLIRDAYNAEAAPAFWVFVNSVSVDEVRQSLVWTEIMDDTDGLTVLQQFGFNVLFNNGTYNPAEENNRDALVEIFPATMPLTRAAVLADATRHATVTEKLFATEATGPGGGNGSASAQSAIAVFAGSVDVKQIKVALELSE